MKNRLIIMALVGAGILTAYGMYRIGFNRGAQSTGVAAPNTTTNTATNTQQQDAATKKPLYWHDPMYPSQKFDKPGKSPFMDMPLVPVYAEAGADNGSVSINPQVWQNTGIRTAEVIRGNLSSAVTAVGNVVYDEREVELVEARNNGFVERLYVRAPLDPVRQGQTLADVYLPGWVTAQEEYLAVKHMQGMDTLVDAARQRMRLAGMNEEQIHSVESSGKVHPRMAITAPISGVITDLAARSGMTVATGTLLFRINGMRNIWINAEVPENLAAQLRPGNPIEASAAALPGTTFRGQINAILPEINPTTRTLNIRIELENHGGELVPGMFVAVRLTPTTGTAVLQVPTEAIIQTGTRSVVMLAQNDGTFKQAEVETGMESHGNTEIRKGLEAGQKVVVSGQFLIDSEASLNGTTGRMSTQTMQTTPTSGAEK